MTRVLRRMIALIIVMFGLLWRHRGDRRHRRNRRRALHLLERGLNAAVLLEEVVDEVASVPILELLLRNAGLLEEAPEFWVDIL